MGCDIHLYGERKIEGVWTALDNFKEDEDGYSGIDDYKNGAYYGRNYILFGVIAGVRKDNIQQFGTKGLPGDVSMEVKKLSDQWDCDGHSHSFLSLKELLSLQDRKTTVEGMKDKNEIIELKNELKKEKPDYDKLYPYCAWGSSGNYESFSVQIPLSYLIADFGERIQKYFINKINNNLLSSTETDSNQFRLANKLNPEDFRIVFWFDN